MTEVLDFAKDRLLIFSLHAFDKVTISVLVQLCIDNEGILFSLEYRKKLGQ